MRGSELKSRAKLGLGHFDISLLGCETQYTITDFYTFRQTVERRHILGGDLVGELLGTGIWAEGIYNFLEDTEDYFEFLIGTDYTFDSGLYTMFEYHHNSLAKSDHEDYDLNDWMRFFTGETKTIASNQFYALVQYPLTDMLTAGGSAVLSVSDMSAAIIPISLSGLGVREGLAVYFFGFYDVPGAYAVATSLFLFVLNTVFPAITGLYFIYNKRAHLNDIKGTLKSTRNLLANLRHERNEKDLK